MFDVGFMELVLISVIGLLVLGPQRLPKVAAELGKWIGRARRTATQLRRQLEREIELEDLERMRAARTAPPPAATTSAPATTPAETPPSASDAAPSPEGDGTTPAPPASLGTPDVGAEPPHKSPQS